MTPLPSLSVVCVFNALDVRADCLDKSLAGIPPGVEVEVIAMDNRDRAFATAGAALNAGARRASNDVVVAVHQDVFLHAPQRLAEVGCHLVDGSFGLIGAIGATPSGNLLGQMRDRVLLIGAHAPTPVEVESVDELLLMVSRDVLLSHPFTEETELSWHAYGVELGLRLRREGLATGAANLGVTHNSMSLNVARLDLAHRHVAARYPERLPLHTTTGVVTAETGPVPSPTVRAKLASRRALRQARRRWRLLKSGQLRRLPTVDLRFDADHLKWSPREPLDVINFDSQGGFTPYAAAPVFLNRNGRELRFWATDRVEAVQSALDGSEGRSVLVTNLTPGPLAALRVPSTVDRLVGTLEPESWLLAGPAARRAPARWRRAR